MTNSRFLSNNQRKVLEHAHLAGMKSKEWSGDMIKTYDAVLISTDHDKIDWQMLVENATLVIDTRNVLNDWHEKYGDKIVRA